jgi:hypothetical protein
MLPLVIVFQKKLGYSIIKKERKKRKRKRTNVPFRNKKRDLEAQVLLKFFKFSKRGI